MNKTELAQQLKVNSEQIDAALQAGSIPSSLEDFSEEQKKIVADILDLVTTNKAPSIRDAGNLYRKSLNETKLSQITAKYQIGNERTPEILKILKLKIEKLIPENWDVIERVCQQLQQGMDLQQAVQSIGEKPKATPVEQTKQEEGETTEGIIVADSATAIARFSESIPDKVEAGLREEASTEAQQDIDEWVEAATEGIFTASNKVLQQAGNFGESLYWEEFEKISQDPQTVVRSQKIIEEVRRRRRPQRHE
jgi:hypothetical protein